MIQNKFKFTNPILQSCNFSINSEFVKEMNKEKSKNEEIKIPIRTSIGKGKIKDNKCVVSMKVEVGNEKAECPFHIVVHMDAKFSWTDENSNRVERFLNISAPALLLGYIRPVISNITNLSPFPSYNVPFMDFTHEMNEKNKVK